jgi:hypothetical protein
MEEREREMTVPTTKEDNPKPFAMEDEENQMTRESNTTVEGFPIEGVDPHQMEVETKTNCSIFFGLGLVASLFFYALVQLHFFKSNLVNVLVGFMTTLIYLFFGYCSSRLHHCLLLAANLSAVYSAVVATLLFSFPIEI